MRSVRCPQTRSRGNVMPAYQPQEWPRSSVSGVSSTEPGGCSTGCSAMRSSASSSGSAGASPRPGRAAPRPRSGRRSRGRRTRRGRRSGENALAQTPNTRRSEPPSGTRKPQVEHGAGAASAIGARRAVLAGVPAVDGVVAADRARGPGPGRGRAPRSRPGRCRRRPRGTSPRPAASRCSRARGGRRRGRSAAGRRRRGRRGRAAATTAPTPGRASPRRRAAAPPRRRWRPSRGAPG